MVYLSRNESGIKNLENVKAEKVPKPVYGQIISSSDSLGSVKIYKSKKRMELRLEPKYGTKGVYYLILEIAVGF